MKRFALLFVAPTLALLLAAVAPLVLGTGTLYTRDVLSGHFAMKTGQALTAEEEGAALIDPFRGGGQPSMGNPNSLPLYPTNLLFRVASPWWAMNAHFWLHWLLVPFAGFWLGRAWGLSREGAWAVGVCYAGSGFLLSLFNLYNLITGATLAPALVAAALDATNPNRRRRTSSFEVGGLWGLSILAGDPLFAVLSALLAVAAVFLASRSGVSSETAMASAGLGPRVRGVLPAVWPMALGTLLASPMLVEMFRILPLSFRGYWQYSAAAVLSQSWDPRAIGEWFLPFVYGQPDFTFWGFRFYGGNPPLLYSLYPGLAALLLVATAGRPKLSKRPLLWAWLAMAAGLFLALGAHNPAVRALLQLPGASLLRYPVKCWLLVAVGGALAGGVGFDRLVEGPGRRWALRIAAILTGAFALVWILLTLLPSWFEKALVGLDPQRLGSAGLLQFELPRWQGLALLSLALAALLMACVAMAGRRPRVAGALILALHLASQTFFLEPLFHADEVAHYRTPPPALDAIPKGARIVHGGFGESFGRLPGSPLEIYPDPRFFWLARTHFEELQPFAAVQWGLRAEMFHSPEGLDSFYLVSMTRALRRLDDAQRIRLLRASGVDTLLLGRPLDAAASELVDLRAVLPSAGHPLYIYGVRDPAPEVALVGSVRSAPHMDSALATLTGPDFDPRTSVVLPGEGPSVEGLPGEVAVLSSTAERLEARVRSSAGGVLVTQRAFLGIHRARVDGELVEPVVANGHRIGVPVPAGEHEVTLWVDRRAYRLGWMAAILAAAALLASVFVARKNRPQTMEEP